MTEKPLTFEAAFPPIQSAIKVYGDKQGMRIQLDIPESAMADAIGLLAWRERVLRVTVEPVNLRDKLGQVQNGESDGQGRMDKRAKRKSAWRPAEIQGDDGDPGESGQPFCCHARRQAHIRQAVHGRRAVGAGHDGQRYHAQWDRLGGRAARLARDGEMALCAYRRGGEAAGGRDERWRELGWTSYR